MAQRHGRQRRGFCQPSLHTTRAAVLGLAGISAIGLAASTRAQQSVLDPKGPSAERIADLSWFLIGLGTAVFVVVMALVIVSVFRGRRTGGEEPEVPGGTGFIIGGIVFSVVVLTVVLAGTLWALSALADDDPGALSIHVVGHQFWWEIRYPDQDVITANELHIPVGEPVRVTLTADDVIHSFWVPELAGKTDLLPNKTNVLTLQADQPGIYRGQCAEFCGIQHAFMAFHVVAEEPEQFAAWLDLQTQPAVEPSSDIVRRGQDVFLGSACVYCHRVEGTNAQAMVGPDLTHLASRDYIAAGTLENNRGNLAGWILDPQAIKPGNLMPGVDLPPEDFQALLTYLESLE